MSIEPLTRFIANAEPTEGVARVAAPAVADCFGAVLAGADSPVAAGVRKAVSDLGPGPARVYGTNVTLSPPYAALANAVAGHAWDMDDWEEPGNTHPTVVLLPALLAASGIAKTDGNTFSGRELLAAYGVGVEVIMRLGQAVSLSHYERGFHSTATLGAIGAAAACARLLGLPEEGIGHAIGFSVSNAVGYTMQFGSNAKPLQAGWPARAGLEAACLAAEGLTSKPETLVSPRGFAGLMGVHDAALLKRAETGLGESWAVEEYGVAIKPWPCCSYAHRMMTAATALRPRLEGRLNEVASISLATVDFHYEIQPYDAPRTRSESLFSLPTCTAQILVHGNLLLADVENDFWKDPQVARLAALMSVTTEKARRPELNFDPEQPDAMQVTLEDGCVLEEAVPYPLGSPQNPMTMAQLAGKFGAVTRRPAAQFEKLLEWPEAEDVVAFFDEAGRG